MIASMTAFGRTEENTAIGRVIWEIRSVNHRYLEISLRLPDDLRILENSIRECISGRISRGKIDCNLRYEPGENIDTGLSVNTSLVQSILASADSIWSSIPDPGKINPIEVLRWPGVINRESPDPEVVGGPLMAQLDKTLDIVVETRQREGGKLRTMIVDRCENIGTIITGIRQKLPEIMAALRERLQNRAEELQVDLENERLEQEVVLLAQKYDVSEELDRLEAHIGEVLNVLKRDEPVGRRLDFLMQELHREANTLGSKSAHYDCSNASVELKVLIEQMREQVQNIE